MSVNLIFVKDNFIKGDNIKFAGGDLYVVFMAMTIAFWILFRADCLFYSRCFQVVLRGAFGTLPRLH